MSAADTANAPSSLIISENYAGLQAQALGLAEAAGLAPTTAILRPRAPWRLLPSALWPAPIARRVAGTWPDPAPDLLIGCGGVAAAVSRAYRGASRTIHVQHPRMNPNRFDLVVVASHDELTGPNVVVTRTALHRATPTRLTAGADAWRDRLAHLPRPLVAVLVGGSNGRFRLGTTEAASLAGQLAAMARRDGVGLAVTPSRRSGTDARRILTDTLAPVGGWVWDMTGHNPYYGLLGLADMVVVTMDSVSMASEAVATTAPVMLAPLPGKSRRIRLFADGLIEQGRARVFAGRFETWTVQALDDTPMAAAEMQRRLNLPC